MLASQPVPMHRRRRPAGCSTLLPRTAASPGQRLSQPDIGRSWISPGVRSARRRLRHKLCGPGEREVARPGGPATVPGQRPAGWRGGGRGRTPPQLLLDRSRLPAGAGPPEPVSHLPNPAPARPRSLPPVRGARATAASGPRCACDRRHRPSGRACFSHWLPPGCVPPLGPTQPGARPAVCLPGRETGNYAPSTAPAACQAAASPPRAAPRPRPRPLGEGPSGPSRNRQAQSRQARDPGASRPRGLRPTIGCGGACAERLISGQHLPPLPQSPARVMAAATALEEAAAAPLDALCGLVQDFVMGQQDGPADQVAADVKSGGYTVLQVVEALGSSLENPDPRTRARGIQLLSGVLLQCHSLLLEKEVVHLILFYENRLKDHHLVIPSVLQGLRALSLSVALPPGLAVSVLKAIFQEVHVQSLLQVDRHTVFSIITNFMRSREEELKGLGADFTFGFIQVMDGEKDPRNLLVAFRIVHDLISKDYSLGPFVEELFEVTSCYFPIDFTPPPNDPYGIQRDDLILSLRAVLASTPRFAEFLLPLLIEKVDSEILSAKLDSLQTLNACCSVYGQKELKDFLPSLWASIRREVFQTASERVEAEGLAALHSLTACLSCSVLRADAEDLLDSFLSNILQDCRHHLCEPDMKLVWPSAKLLQAAAGASARACEHITSTVLPLLLEQFHKHSQSNQRRTILEMILGFLKLQQKWSYEDKDERPLTRFKDQLCSLVFMALTDPSTQLQLVGIRTLTVLGSQPDLLSSGDLELAIGHLYRLSFLEEDSESCRVAALEASGTLTTLYPGAFSSHLLPKLAKELHKGESDVAREDGLMKCSRHFCCLQALSAISTHPSIVKETLPLLLQRLCQANKGNVVTESSEVIAICQSLQQVAEKCQQDPESYWYFHETAIPCLFGLAVQASMPEKESSVLRKVLLEDEVLAALASVIGTATTHLSPELAAQSVTGIVPLFLDGNTSFLPENSFPSRFQPFQDGSSAQRRLVALLTAFVCSLPRNVEIPQLKQLMRELLQQSRRRHSCPFASTAAAKCLSGLLNKHPPGQQLDEFLQLAVDTVETGLASGSSRNQAFVLLLWVTKALVLRYHPLSACLTARLMGLLSDPELGPAAADGFSLLMSDCTDVLTRAGHADVRIMFRQRFFTDNVPALVQGFHAAPQDVKPNYLKGLSHVLNRLPKPVLLPELPTLLSLLLEALSCHDSVVQLSTLSCLQPLLLESPQIMSLHIDTLVTKFLTLSSSHSMAVRIAALQCMHALTRLPAPVLLPYKSQVIRALAKPLDDKKRLVRKEAVSARGEWFLLGSPGS